MNAVVFLSTRCHFCTESMPFYRQVAGIQRPGLTLSVLAFESPGEVRKLLSRANVAVGGVYRIRETTGLSSTPTLLILDGGGIVKRVFEGRSILRASRSF